MYVCIYVYMYLYIYIYKKQFKELVALEYVRLISNIYHNDCYLRLFIFKLQMNNNSFFKK